MSKAGNLIKNIVKAKKESVMGKLANGDDPMEPWSKRFDAPIKEEELNEDTWLYRYIRSLGWDPTHMTFAQRSKYARSNAFKHWKQSHMNRRPGETATMEKPVQEEILDEAGTGLLMSYIKSKGLDPRTMDGNQKAAYSKSSEFRIFKMRHMKEVSGMGERGDDWNEEKKPVKEAIDKADTVTVDIPLMIRLLEYAREDAKTDMDLHKVVENLINMRSEGVLSMDHYDKIVSIKGMKEEYGPAATAAMRQRQSPYQVSTADRKDRENKLNIDRSRAADAQKVSRGEDPTLTHAGNAALKVQQDRWKKQRLNSEETEKIDELSKSTLTSYATKARAEGEKLTKQGDSAMKRSSAKSMQTSLDKFRKATKRHMGAASAESKARVKEDVEQIGEMKKQNDNMEIDDRITREEKKMKGSDPCWKGYQMVGTKKKGGRTVPNCVPEETKITEGIYGIEDSPLSATNSVKAMEYLHIYWY